MKFVDVQRGYANMWSRAVIRPEHVQAARTEASLIKRDQGRYGMVSSATGVPWWWIAIVHHLESNRDFRTHLHNGDPLTARTTHVPAGRPPSGEPPFTWQASAIDALLLKKLDQVEDWSVARALYEFERYNGFGYYGKGVNSPYVWSYTNHYEKGKYVADGQYDPDHVSKQIGAAALLLALIDADAVSFEKEKDPMSEIRDVLAAFKNIAPALAAAAGGPMALIAVRAVADALDVPNASAAEVKEKMEAAPLATLVAALKQAESLVTTIVPPDKPATPPAPVAPEAGPLDKVLGGEALKGWKTIVGGGLFTLVYVLDALHLFPGVLTPDLVQALLGVATFIAGVGLTAKIERWFLWLKPKAG